MFINSKISFNSSNNPRLPRKLINAEIKRLTFLLTILFVKLIVSFEIKLRYFLRSQYKPEINNVFDLSCSPVRPLSFKFSYTISSKLLLFITTVLLNASLNFDPSKLAIF
jgi:hypothetical protein